MTDPSLPLAAAEGPEIDCLLAADYAEVVNGKLYMLGGGWDRRGVADFSQPQSFSIVVGVTFGWNDTNRPIALDIVLQDADGAPLMPPFQTQLTVGRPPQARPGQRLRCQLAINLYAPIPRPGEYVIHATLDGRVSRRYPIFVDPVPTTR